MQFITKNFSIRPRVPIIVLENAVKIRLKRGGNDFKRTVCDMRFFLRNKTHYLKT